MRRDHKDTISVDVERTADGFLVRADVGAISISTNAVDLLADSDVDFAAWLLLPIAMCTGRSIHIKGAGSLETQRNAEVMSRAWESWAPWRFSATKISFDTSLAPRNKPKEGQDLCFYSGGIDSTHMIIDRSRKGETQDLITIHGMDYSPNEDASFDQLRQQLSGFAASFGRRWILTKTNAYDVYKKFQINLKQHQITHIFSLAACGMAHNKHYSRIYIAADYRLDQQFSVAPWGSNTATNRFFSGKEASLITYGDDITRSEKLPLIMESPLAMEAVSFCKKRTHRPRNCGECSKCIRTKLMFLAEMGEIPNVFRSLEVASMWSNVLPYKNPADMAFALDIINSARRNGSENLLPNFNENADKIMRYAKYKSRLRFSKDVAAGVRKYASGRLKSFDLRGT